jgi:hypothetical protein
VRLTRDLLKSYRLPSFMVRVWESLPSERTDPGGPSKLRALLSRSRRPRGVPTTRTSANSWSVTLKRWPPRPAVTTF